MCDILSSPHARERPRVLLQRLQLLWWLLTTHTSIKDLVTVPIKVSIQKCVATAVTVARLSCQLFFLPSWSNTSSRCMSCLSTNTTLINFWRRRQQSLLPPIVYSVWMTLRREGREGFRCANNKAAWCLLALLLRLFVRHLIFCCGVILGFWYPNPRTYKSYAKKLNCWINDVFYSTLCSTFPCWELIWYPQNQQNMGGNNTVLRVCTRVP